MFYILFILVALDQNVCEVNFETQYPEMLVYWICISICSHCFCLQPLFLKIYFATVDPIILETGFPALYSNDQCEQYFYCFKQLTTGKNGKVHFLHDPLIKLIGKKQLV